MSREVCGICWCPYDEDTGECACAPAPKEPVAWYHVPYPNNGVAPMVSLGRQHEPSMYGAAVPLFLGSPNCPNCASLEAQNNELDRKLAEMEAKLNNPSVDDAFRILAEANRRAIDYINELERQVNELKRAEREACADIADQHASIEGIAQRIAAEIRGQG